MKYHSLVLWDHSESKFQIYSWILTIIFCEPTGLHTTPEMESKDIDS